MAYIRNQKTAGKASRPCKKRTKGESRMKKRLFSALLAVVMLFTMMPTAFAEEGSTAQIGETSFATLAEAMDAAESGDTITLLKDTVSGEFIDVGKNCPSGVTFDLNGFTLTLDPSGGSTGTKTSGFRVLKGKEATVMNGKVAAHFSQENRVKVVFANYGTLTIEDVEILHTGDLTGDAGDLVAYTINNGGKLDIVNSEITNEVAGAETGCYALMHADYLYGNTSVIYIDEDSKVNGDVYIGAGTEDSVLTSEGDIDGAFIESKEGAQVEILGGTYSHNVSAYVASGLAQDENGAIVTDPASIAKIGKIGYPSLAAAMAAAASGDTITLLQDTVSGEFIDVGKNCASGVTFDLNDCTLTLDPSGGSTGTKTSGFRVLKGKEATVKNGKVKAEFSQANRVKVMFANYGTLTLEDLEIVHTGDLTGDAGDLVAYTINNGGKLDVVGCAVENTVTGAEEGSFALVHADYMYGNTSEISVDADSEMTGDISVGSGTEDSVLTYAGTLNGAFVEDPEDDGARVEVVGGLYSEPVDPTYLANGLDTELQHKNGMYSYYTSVDKAAAAAGDGDVIVDLNDPEDAYCTVSFDTGRKSTSWTEIVAQGSKAEEPEDPEKNGYVFDGWYLGGERYDFDDAVTESITLEAEWIRDDRGDHKVIVKSAKNGDVDVSPDYADKGDTVTIFVEPDEGYVLDELTVTDAKGNAVDVNRKTASHYTFKMPGSKVTIEAVFVRAEEAGALPFTDVNKSDACYEAVRFVYENGLMTGIGDGTVFAPSMSLSRAMTARMFHTLEKNPAAPASAFADVARGMWYTGAIDWASSAGVIAGYGSGAFGPDDDVTREQLAVMLFQYAKSKGYDVSGRAVLSAADAAGVSFWAMDAVQWAVQLDVLTGNGVGYLAASDAASRSDVAQAFMAFVQHYA